MANNKNAQSAPKDTVASLWAEELDFQRAMGWQSVCKFAIVTLAITSVAGYLLVKYLG